MKIHRIACATFLLAAALCVLGCRGQEASQVRVDPDVAIEHYVRGEMLASRGELEAALAELSKALESDPLLASAYASMGDIYRRQETYDMAVVMYEKAAEANPYNFRTFYYLALTHQLMADAAKGADEIKRHLAAAVQAYVTALTLKDDDYDANLNLGVCYYSLDQLDQAERYFLRAVELKPDQPAPYTNLGAIYDSQGRLYDAVRMYKESLERDNRQPRVLVFLATAYVKQGRFKAAITDYELAAEMDTTSPLPRERLGYCYYYTQEYAKSIDAYKTALSLDTRCAEARRGLGVVYMTQYLLNKQQQDLREMALREWNISLELNPNQQDLMELVRKYTPSFQGPSL